MATPAALGIDIGGTSVKLGLVANDEAATVLARASVPTPEGGAADAMFEAIAEAGHRLLADSSVAVAAVGISVAGIIDAGRDVLVYNANIPDLSGTPVRSRIEALFGLPAALDADANSAAWGEYRHGAGRGARRLLAITVGTGIGGGVVIDGALVRHTGETAGDLGHVIIRKDGWRCACGARGCLEAYAGSAGLRRRAGGRGTRQLIADAAAGDDGAIRALGRTGEDIGFGLVTLAHIYAPDVIVVGGGVSHAGDRLLGPLRASFAARVAPFFGQDTRIVPATLGNDAGLVGAARQALDALVR